MKRTVWTLLACLAFVACEQTHLTQVNPTEFVEIPVIIPGEPIVITVPVQDTVVVNVLIEIAEKSAKEIMWLRGALEEIASIECGDDTEAHPLHQHRADVCEIARKELDR